MLVFSRAEQGSRRLTPSAQDKALIGARREAAQHLQRVRECDDAVAKLEAEARSMRDQVALSKAEVDR